MRFELSPPKETLDKWAKELGERAAKAATSSVREAGEMALRDGRASIAAAGFSSRWTSGLRLDVFPKNGISLNAAAVIRHKIPYAGIFETGGTIAGKPFLWIPITKNLPLRSGGRRQTPSRFAKSSGSKLISLRGRGNRAPILAVRRGSRTIPVFVGVGRVELKKRFDVTGAIKRAAAQLSSLFEKHFKT